MGHQGNGDGQAEGLRVEPAAAPLRGRVRVPGDKSIGHRAVMLGALGEGTSRIDGLSDGQDNARTVAAFSAMGVAVRRTGPGSVEIDGRGLGGLRAPAEPIDCGNSGTSIRLLSGVLAAQRFPSVLDGDVYLRARPMRRVVDPLAEMGARITGEAGKKAGEIYPPLRLAPAEALRGIRYASPIASAQVKSAILLCGLWAEGPTEVIEPARSRDHSERMLRHLGVPLIADDDPAGGARSRIDPAGWRRSLPPLSLTIPGDLSSSAFLLGAALLVPGSEVVVQGVGLNPTRTGLLDALAQLCPGAVEVLDARDVAGEPVGDLRARRGGALSPMRIEGDLALRALDELPLLAALSAAAEGETVISGASELRVKESDRIAATCALLRAFGVECEERPDGMIIKGRGPGALRGAVVDSFGDHRIAMAAAVLALVADGATEVRDTGNIATSYPGFTPTLTALGAHLART